MQILLDKLNGIEITQEGIIKRPLSANVDYGEVFLYPKQDDLNYISRMTSTIFFIKNENSKYVGMVYLMEDDLHWFIEEQYRGKGYLTKALRSSILFEIFENRRAQRITIDRNEIGEEMYEASLHVATSLGFEKVNDLEYYLNADNFMDCNHNDERIIGIDELRLNRMSLEIFLCKAKLAMLKNELKREYEGSDIYDDLEDSIILLEKVDNEIENNGIAYIR